MLPRNSQFRRAIAALNALFMVFGIALHSVSMAHAGHATHGIDMQHHTSCEQMRGMNDEGVENTNVFESAAQTRMIHSHMKTHSMSEHCSTLRDDESQQATAVETGLASDHSPMGSPAANESCCMTGSVCTTACVTTADFNHSRVEIVAVALLTLPGRSIAYSREHLVELQPPR